MEQQSRKIVSRRDHLYDVGDLRSSPARDRPFAVPVEELADYLNVQVEEGLSDAEARLRLDQYGQNTLEAKAPPSFWIMLLGQFRSPLIVLLLLAAGAAFFISDPQDAVVIVIVVAINTVIGAVQEFRAERALSALQAVSAPHARALRDGIVREIPAAELVPGDIVLVRAGEVVPADGRLIEGASVQVDESQLTGESLPIDKQADITPAPFAALPDRGNVLHMGTAVTFGHGRALIFATGPRAEMGRLARALNEAESRATPLERQVTWLAKVLSVLAVAAAAAVLVLGLFRGHPATQMLLVSVSLAVAAVPSGLPAVVTIVLALGVQRMAQRRAIVRRLSAVEALGAATVIATDKTGTLTLGEMRTAALVVDGRRFEVREGELWDDGHRVESEALPSGLQDLLRAAVLVNNAVLEPAPLGDPTEQALLYLARDLGINRAAIETAWPRIAEVPFSSHRKRMTTLHRNRDETVAYIKGAPDLLIPRCSHVIRGGRPVALDDSQRAEAEAILHALGDESLRVLALAERRAIDTARASSAAQQPDDLERDLALLGFIALIDPARPDVPAALSGATGAGIRTVMITGDHPKTAAAIANELGIDSGAIVTGADLERIGDSLPTELVRSASVFARVAPQQKLAIVRALQDAGEVVAMTGDGANDAPALRQADIGVAMGIRGTQVAKEAASIVLTDDHYATIVSATEEGRVIYANLRKAVMYLLSGNLGEILVLFIAMLANLPLPLQPAQILWINLVTDPLPGLGLGMDPGQRDVMAQGPRQPHQAFLERAAAPIIVIPSVLLALVTLAAFSIALARDPADLSAAQTSAFVTLVLAHVGIAWPLRSLTSAAFRASPFTNPVLLSSVIVGAGLLLVLVYTAFGNELFHTEPLDLTAWIITLGLTPIPFLGAEITKAVHRFRGRREQI